ncbi:MAG TPA: hypothetical protein VII33_05730, partial [Nakamurella sp.]
MDDTVPDLVPEAAAPAPSAAAPQVPAPLVLPSARLARLAELTATELAGSANNGGAAGPQVPEEALSGVWAAVDASTAANTKKAYRSDWARFTTWAGERGFPALPAPALVVAHYLTAAAAEQTGVGRWRYTPATLSRWVSSINQFHTAAGLDPPGRSEIVRRALSGVRRIRATPPRRRNPLLLADIRTLLTSITESAADWPAGVAAR